MIKDEQTKIWIAIMLFIVGVVMFFNNSTLNGINLSTFLIDFFRSV